MASSLSKWVGLMVQAKNDCCYRNTPVLGARIGGVGYWTMDSVSIANDPVGEIGNHRMLSDAINNEKIRCQEK
jgi:hypothetical protein